MDYYFYTDISQLHLIDHDEELDINNKCQNCAEESTRIYVLVHKPPPIDCEIELFEENKEFREPIQEIAQ